MGVAYEDAQFAHLSFGRQGVGMLSICPYVRSQVFPQTLGRLIWGRDRD